MSCTTGFSYIFVFMAGTSNFGQRQASTVVVSISSASPLASFPIMLAVAGAITTQSALSASAMCSTSQGWFRSKVSVTVLL